MSSDKNKKINKWELERERRSNFVIDLRTKQAEKAKIVDNFLPDKIIKFKEKIKNIKVNLLRSPRRTVWSFLSTCPLTRLKSRFCFKSLASRVNLAKLRNISWSQLMSINIKPPQRVWLKIIQEKRKIFSTPTKVRAKRKRVKTIERKVIWYRSLLSFALILIIIIIPLKILSYFQFLDLKNLENKILNHSQSALSDLMAATKSVDKLDFKSADYRFSQASQNFLAAQTELNKINDSILVLASLSNNPKLKLVAESKKFLAAGAISSSLGHNLVLATDSLFNSEQGHFSEALDRFAHFGNLAVLDAQKLKDKLAEINPNNLPQEYRSKFVDLQKKSNFLASSLADFVEAGVKLKKILGGTHDKRYLLVFQNNAELRASGGFLGSYALVDLRNGKIRNLEVPGGGSYDTEAGMRVLVKAPQPLWLVNPLWHFWDANWWPDWPTTAKNLMWFYEKSNGPTVDGVISITPTVVEKLLQITGPIDLTKEYGLIITSDNFWETVQKVTENKNLAKFTPQATLKFKKNSDIIKTDIPLQQGLKNNSANKPKKIIGDLMAKILEILPQKLDKDNLVKILGIFEESMSEKQILFYFTDPQLEAEVAKRNWAGQVKNTKYDYLLVVDTNIGGQKSDRKIIESIKHFSKVLPSGEIINTLQISRQHTGLKHESLVGVRNVDWLRVYVPRGSQLISAQGFISPAAKYLQKRPDPSWKNSPLLANENKAKIDKLSGTKIYQEDDKTVFANWLMVDPGQTVTVTIKYRLPFNLFKPLNQPLNLWQKINKLLNPRQSKSIPYSLLVQKQPGTLNDKFSSQLLLPSGFNIFWQYPNNIKTTTGWQIKDSLQADKYYSILINKQSK